VDQTTINEPKKKKSDYFIRAARGVGSLIGLGSQQPRPIRDPTPLAALMIM